MNEGDQIMSDTQKRIMALQHSTLEQVEEALRAARQEDETSEYAVELGTMLEAMRPYFTKPGMTFRDAALCLDASARRAVEQADREARAN